MDDYLVETKRFCRAEKMIDVKAAYSFMDVWREPDFYFSGKNIISGKWSIFLMAAPESQQMRGFIR